MNAPNLRFLAPLLCALAVLAAYSNCTPNRFTLDDWHTIERNPAVRSFDAPHLSRFFTDVTTFSVLKANLDYRPALLVTYAANHALSQRLHGDGYDPRTWHWFNMALHAIACTGLYFVGRALIGSDGLAPLPGLNPGHADAACLAAALLFAIHPIASGSVNYISARSSLMVAALLLPALAVYLRVLSGALRWPWLLATAALFIVALLTKIEAISFVGALAAAELLLAPALIPLPLFRRVPEPRALARLAVFALIGIALVGLWRFMSPLDESGTKAQAGMTPAVYLLNQTRAWWYYIGQALAPVRLVFDEAAYPVAGIVTDARQAAAGEKYSALLALADPRVLLAIAGWLIVAALAFRSIRPAPAVAFLLACYIIFLSPTSSVAPLAEMVNDHRPYLPLAGLFILASAGACIGVRRVVPCPGSEGAGRGVSNAARAAPAIARSPQLILVLSALLLAVPLVLLTRARNDIFRDDLSLWADTVEKSPASGRAQMNYGLALMQRARYPEAQARFRQSLFYWPNWHYTHTNLAICLAAQGDIPGATASHDRAVQIGAADSGPYYWRGRFRASQGDLPGAIADFQAAIDRNPSPFSEAVALASCLSRVGRAQEADAITARYSTPDPSGFAREWAAFEEVVFRPR